MEVIYGREAGVNEVAQKWLYQRRGKLPVLLGRDKYSVALAWCARHRNEVLDRFRAYTVKNDGRDYEQNLVGHRWLVSQSPGRPWRDGALPV